jgi:predicted MFS family arabinose efflux permease
VRRIPRYGRVLLNALQFSHPDRAELKHLDHAEWQKLLALCDSTQLTLLLGYLCESHLPDEILSRIDRNYLDNAKRFDRLKAAVIEISDSLAQRSIDFCVLKGFAHSPHFTPDPRLRAQGDIDLWCQSEQLLQAKEALVDLGYRPFGKSKGRHLDPMIRETSWEWSGDYYAPDLPIPVDLHFSMWDEKMEGIPGPQEQDLWKRRQSLIVDGQAVLVLDPADSLAFAALHLMMHLLHGDLRLQRAWELAYFIESHADDQQFWIRWRGLHAGQSGQLQFIAFTLVSKWFGCRRPELLEREADFLPPDVLLWISHYGFSPVENLFVPNKDEVWLNLCLLKSYKAKVRVFARRLLPLKAAAEGSNGPKDDAPINGTNATLQRIRFLLERSAVHVRTMPLTCLRGLQWWWIRQQIGRDFLVFLFASVLFDFGEFVFFLLYNFYLLGSGFDEKFIGQVSAVLTAGTFVGTIPAAAISNRLGLRGTVLIALAGTAAAAAFRTFAIWPFALLAAAFLNGLFFSFWAVSLPPAVAGLTNSRNRTLAFSLITSIGVGIGAVAGLIGGYLPGLLKHLHPSFSSIGSSRAALLLGSGCVALAIVPALWLRFPPLPRAEKIQKQYPSGPFIYAFLTALFVWTIGTSGFNPFFNVYFSRHLHITVAQIGLAFSYGQIAQVIAIPLAPFVLKRTGDLPGIAMMQLATAVALALLAVVSNSRWGILLYVAYMACQYMSEPGLFSMLMSRVDRSHQSGAAALNFLATSLAGIFAAALSGSMLSRFGYEPVLAACAGVISIAAALFYFLVPRR